MVPPLLHGWGRGMGGRCRPENWCGTGGEDCCCVGDTGLKSFASCFGAASAALNESAAALMESAGSVEAAEGGGDHSVGTTVGVAAVVPSDAGSCRGIGRLPAPLAVLHPQPELQMRSRPSSFACKHCPPV